MNFTEKKWLILDNSVQNDPESLIESVLKARGVRPSMMGSFLSSNIESVTFKSVGIDEKEVVKAIKRIADAILSQEHIVVYGDYDVDGITGAAILWETLSLLGANALPYIPHRVDEGYGLSEKGIENLLATNAPKLIITVDNGIVANKAVDFAKEKGIDVIITDHHMPDKDHQLPKSHSLIHTTSLCGSSVALLLSKALKDSIQGHESAFDREHVMLAALATVADLVPLTGQNRIILKSGLSTIRSTKRLGLKELFLVAGLEGKEIGVYEIGHIISPRINAAGRIESGMDSLRLLCTKDQKKARSLALMLDETNTRRQGLMKDSATLAIERVGISSQDKKIIVVDDEEFEEGIIGLVAGKLVEEFYRPSIAIAKRKDISKGSVRSVSGVNVIELLRSMGDVFINVGGHPMAAGFTIKTSNIPRLKKELVKKAESVITDDQLLRTLKIDAVVPLSFQLAELFNKISSIGPFGMGNPEPTFLSKKVLIRDIRIIGKEKTHVRFVLSEEEISTPFEAIAFGMAERANDLEKDDQIDIVYTLDTNTWNDVTKLQLKIKDFKSYIHPHRDE